MPESPAFALKHRVHREPKVEEVRDIFCCCCCCMYRLYKLLSSPSLHSPNVPSHHSHPHVNNLKPGGDFAFCQVKQPSPVKAPPVPHFGLPFQPRLPENHHVEVCPFSFEERERERRVLKEKRLADQRNEEVKSLVLNLSLYRGIRTKC